MQIKSTRILFSLLLGICLIFSACDMSTEVITDIDGNLSGTITVDGETSDLSGYMMCLSGTSYMSITDYNGNFTIFDVPVGSDYSLLAVYNGKNIISKTGITISTKGIDLGTLALNSSDFTSDVKIQNSGSSSAIASDGGISFTVSSPSSNSDFKNKISIIEHKTGIEMYKYFNEWPSWDSITFPFVEAGNSYHFTVQCSDSQFVYYKDEYTITASAGLGELSVTNTNDTSISYDAETNIVSLDNEPEFNLTNMVILSRESFMIILKDGLFVYSEGISDTHEYYNTFHFDADSDLVFRWRTFEQLDAMLAGHNFTVTYSLIFTVLGYESWNFQWKNSESESFTYVNETKVESRVVWNLNGGSGSFPDELIDFNSYITEPLTIPIYEGYRFKGWGTDEFDTEPLNFQHTRFPNVTFNSVTEKYEPAVINLYAIWEEL